VSRVKSLGRDTVAHFGD